MRSPSKLSHSMNDPESPAKNYQINELTTAVNNLVASNQRIETKIDNQLVTKEQLETALKLVGVEIRQVDEKYSPIKKSLSRVTWIVIGVVIPLVVMSGIQLLANVLPKGGA